MQKTIKLGRWQTGLPTVLVKREIMGHPVQWTLDLNAPTQRYMYDVLQACEWYEHKTVNEMAMALKDGGVFFDVGAHIGYFTVIAEAFCGSKNVVAFEPDPANYRALRLNAPNVSAWNNPVGECESEILFYHNLDNDGGHALWNPALHEWNKQTIARPSRMYQVPLNGFASFFPTVIKIDTEGAELRVLRGASEILKQPQLKLVICELNEFGLAQLGDSEKALREYMDSFGFHAEGSTETDSVGNLFFKR